MVARAAVSLFLMAAASFLVACGDSAVDIDFSQAEEAPTQAPSVSGDVIRMAIAPVLSALPSFTLYQDLADYLADRLGRPVELVQGKTYAEINDLVKSNDVTLALVCTNPYLQGRDDFGMELLVAPEVRGEPFYYSLLIVGSAQAASTLQELRGRSFAFTDPLSNTGRLAPLYQLALLGQTPESFFSRAIFTYAHDNSIRAVAEGIVDAAAVDSLVYDYLAATEPTLVAGVRVIEKWGPFGINPFVVNPGLDPKLKAQLRDTFLTMNEDSRGRDLLARFMVDRFIVPDDGIYDSVREMRAYLRERGLSQ